MFTQCAHYVGITVFQKIMKSVHFIKWWFSIKFENVNKMWLSPFWYKRCDHYLKNIEYTLIHIKIYGGKHYI